MNRYQRMKGRSDIDTDWYRKMSGVSDEEALRRYDTGRPKFTQEEERQIRRDALFAVSLRLSGRVHDSEEYIGGIKHAEDYLRDGTL